ncbi:methyltransferase domain-containing protein [Nocardioides KLBMP 9356]|uniref:Methyltransferase domain-containing protein n=1 Tax=Nocardioides potassii TaxID=2911371 RepID=A0ABS9H751_9ACTN|nr:methyltransferase domain-containing protein [Nocardioides potassii]MCF6377057.1 methyltransferase domain-containing protein [Nocardioides potassii]
MTTYTHGHAEAVLRSHRWRTAENWAAHLLPHLRDDQRLLDVGSGPGTITADLARIVREVVAVEINDAAADLTRAELLRQGVTNATVVVGDVHALDLTDDEFDVVHAHQVLQHVSDPIGALREMLRVTRPGGLVAARDSDYGHFSWYPPTAGLDRWLELYDGAARANGGEPHAGRMLLAWAHAAGATDVVASSATWCFATPEDRTWWGNLWADRLTSTALARQLVDSGRATPDELDDVAASWRGWADDPDGWFSVLHGEVLIRA